MAQHDSVCQVEHETGQLTALYSTKAFGGIRRRPIDQSGEAEMPSISEKPRIVYIHSNFDIQQYSTQFELQSERKCLFFLNIINPFKDEYSTTDEALHQTIVKILLKHLKAEIRSQYNCWPMYNIPSSSLSLKYLYTTNEHNKHVLPSDIICKEYCHLHGICWQSIKADKSLYDKMREYLNNFRLEIVDALVENKARTTMNDESEQ